MSRLRSVLLAVPLAGLPLAGAFGLFSLNQDADARRHAALELQKLGNDLNATTADIGWAIVFRLPTATAVPRFTAGMAEVDQDLANLRANAEAGTPTRNALAATNAYLAYLSYAPLLLDGPLQASTSPGGSFSAASLTNASIAAHLQAKQAIDAAAVDLTSRADGADRAMEIGIWTIFLGVSAALLVIVRRRETARRVAAVAEAGRLSLEESERTYRLLFENNPAPMFTFDASTLRFLSVNRAAVDTYGYSEMEFRSMTVTDIRHPSDREALVETVHDAGRRTLHLGTRHVLKIGRPIDVEITVEPIEDLGRSALLVMVRDVTDQLRLEAELRNQAFHDQLTGLANHALLVDRFERAQAVRTREGSPLSLICLDLDGFGTLNETDGHAAGDAVLRAVADRLSGTVRPLDTVARIGSNRFAVLAEETALPGADQLATRLRAAIEEPLLVAGRPVVMTASAGVTPVESTDLACDAALQQASAALHDARSAGVSRQRVYQPQMQNQVRRRMEIAGGLTRAIAAGELSLVYQPIVATRPGGHVDRVEALLRWRSPVLGDVSPAEFIPIAEANGSIVQMGEWVLRAACQQVAEWRRLGRKVVVSVNVSGRQLREPSFGVTVRKAVVGSGIEPSQLAIELTETAVLEDLDAARTVLEGLRAYGVTVALDDFGAGYSSLSYLTHLPLDTVKIDRAFVSSLESADRRAMMLTIVRLLDSIRVGIVAEGVETASQVEYLMTLGVDEFQGYYFSRPVSADQVPAVFERGWLEELGAVAAAAM